MLMNPGPAMDREAIGRGYPLPKRRNELLGYLAGFSSIFAASCIAALVEKSPWDSCFGISRATENSGSASHSASFFRTAEKTMDSTICRASNCPLDG